MATRLYFQNIANGLSGTFPSDEQSNYPSYGGSQSYAASGASTLRKMDAAAGASQTSASWTTLANTTAQEVFIRMFTSLPLSGNQTVGGGNFILNFAHAESNTNVNLFKYGINIYVWRPSSGTKVGTIKQVLTFNSVVGSEPSSASSERVWHQSGISSSAISALNDDVIIVEIFVDFAQGMATSYSGTWYYDGTTVNTTDNTAVSNHASFIEFAENLTFKSFNKKGEFFKIMD